MRIFAILVLVSPLIGCGQKPVSFHEQIQPILNNRCLSCHSAERAAGKIVLTSYEMVMSSRTVHGKKPLVISGIPSESWLYILSGTDQPHFRMPPDTSSAAPLPHNEVQVIGKWITQGAKNN